MAASNLICFWKQCKCATCRSVCSRCKSSVPFDVTDGCGTVECDRWNPLTWEQYKAGLGWTGDASAITEMDFIKARYGIRGTEFDRLYQEGVIKSVQGHFKFDTMMLFARLRQLRIDSKERSLNAIFEQYVREGDEGWD